MTDSNIAFSGKLISLETGQRVIQDHEKTQIIVEPSVLFKVTTDTITCLSNPNSRELFIGDAGFKQSVRRIHQIAPDILLLKRSERDRIWHNWTMVNTQGKLL